MSHVRMIPRRERNPRAARREAHFTRGSRRTQLVLQYQEIYDGMGRVVAQRYIRHVPEVNRQITHIPLIDAQRKVSDFSPLMASAVIDLRGASEESLAAWAKVAGAHTGHGAPGKQRLS